MLAPGPRQRPWTITFGSFTLCSRAPRKDIVLERVRWDASVEPLEVQPVLRKASPGDGGQPVKLGSYPDFSEPYSDGRHYGGTPLPTIAGVHVKPRCGPSVPNGFVELLMVLTFDQRGGRIDRIYVDYTADGKPYTLLMEWFLAGCGNALREPDDIKSCAEMPPGS